MKGHSVSRVFSQPLTYLRDSTATMLERLEGFDDVRCHELVRAVAIAADFPDKCLQDGYYGFVEHSWLWVPNPPVNPLGNTKWPHILDVYCVGRLPQVQLIACDSVGLPHVGWSYRPSDRRGDIDESVVAAIVRALTKRTLNITIAVPPPQKLALTPVPKPAALDDEEGEELPETRRTIGVEAPDSDRITPHPDSCA
jgi:hypothetical protein